MLAGSPGAIAAWRDTFELLAGVMKRVAMEPDARVAAPVVGGEPPRPADAPRPPPPSRRHHTPLYPWVPRAAPRSERKPASGRDTLPSL